MSNSIAEDRPSFRLRRANQHPLNGVYIKRFCRHCPIEITHMHGNTLMCASCSQKIRYQYQRESETRRRPITCRAIVVYMELYAPNALKDIKSRIKAIRKAGNDDLLQREPQHD